MNATQIYPQSFAYIKLIAFLSKTYNLNELKYTFNIALNINYLNEEEKIIHCSRDEIAATRPISGG